jgi:hypothetical protein
MSNEIRKQQDPLFTPQEKIESLSKESLAVLRQFPTDVLEEIFVRLLEIPKDRFSSSQLKIASQTCRQWHSICNSNTFWFKATSLYFPEFVSSSKNDPHISFMQEFKKLACQTYDLNDMAIVWLNEQYWKTVVDEDTPRGSEVLSDDIPSNILPCKGAVLSSTFARLDSVCWFDAAATLNASYPSRTKLLMCIKLHNFYLGPLQLNILAGVKNSVTDEPSWQTISTYEWSEDEQHKCPENEWVYIDLGTVDIDGLNHGESTITLRGQIFSTTPNWKNGIYINHLKCIQLPKT